MLAPLRIDGVAGNCRIRTPRFYPFDNSFEFHVLDEGKTLCLFYNTPEEGRIYKRLGFKDIGMWTMHR
jgi:hypothetical protein